ADRLALEGDLALVQAGLGTADALGSPLEQHGDPLVRIGLGHAGGDGGAAVLFGELAAGSVHGKSSVGGPEPMRCRGRDAPDAAVIGRVDARLERQSPGDSRSLSELALPCSCITMVSMAVNCEVYRVLSFSIRRS